MKWLYMPGILRSMMKLRLLRRLYQRANENLRDATEAFQRQMITRALEQNNRNWAACARALEMDVANLHRLAKRLGLKG